MMLDCKGCYTGNPLCVIGCDILDGNGETDGV